MAAQLVLIFEGELEQPIELAHVVGVLLRVTEDVAALFGTEHHVLVHIWHHDVQDLLEVVVNQGYSLFAGGPKTQLHKGSQYPERINVSVYLLLLELGARLDELLELLEDLLFSDDVAVDLH